MVQYLVLPSQIRVNVCRTWWNLISHRCQCIICWQKKNKTEWTTWLFWLLVYAASSGIGYDISQGFITPSQSSKCKHAKRTWWVPNGSRYLNTSAKKVMNEEIKFGRAFYKIEKRVTSKEDGAGCQVICIYLLETISNKLIIWTLSGLLIVHLRPQHSSHVWLVSTNNMTIVKQTDAFQDEGLWGVAIFFL